MKKTAIIVIVLTIISKILGLIREMTLSYNYGTSSVSDAFLISITIPSIIFTFIGISISTGYIPMYSRLCKSEGVDSANQYTNNITIVMTLLSLIIVIFGFIFAPYIVKLFASGFEGETFEIAVILTRFSLFSLIFMGASNILQSFLQVNDDYISPALIGIPMNLVLIISIVFSSLRTYYFLGAGIVISTAIQVVFLWPFAKKKGLHLNLTLDLNDPNIKTMLSLAIPVILGVAVNDLNVIVDRTLASRIVEGGISALNYADTLNKLVYGIFVLSIGTVTYPLISNLASDKDYNRLKNIVHESIKWINFIIVPTTVGMIVFSKELISLLYGRGNFNQESIIMTASALAFYSLGVLGISWRLIIGRIFYSFQDTRTPMMNSIIGVLVNVVLNVILSKYMGISGLALGTSIASYVTIYILINSLKKKVYDFQFKEIIPSFFKILTLSLCVMAVSKKAHDVLLLPLQDDVAILIIVVVSLILYFIGLQFLGIEEYKIKNFMRIIRKKI